MYKALLDSSILLKTAIAELPLVPNPTIIYFLKGRLEPDRVIATFAPFEEPSVIIMFLTSSKSVALVSMTTSSFKEKIPALWITFKLKDWLTGTPSIE